MVANPAPRVVKPPGEVVYRSWRSPLLLVHTSWRLTLSPRVRGNRGVEAREPIHRRSIPACTGKPRTPARPTTTTAVYPRVYGETGQILSFEGVNDGLSPRVRGNLL